MTTTVYISNNKIYITTGRQSLYFAFNKITVKRHLSFNLPEKLCSGGLVINEKAFAEYIKNLWAVNNLPKSGISLVICGNHFITKVFNMPLISLSKTLDYIQREFMDIGRSREPVLSFFTLYKNRKIRQRRIFCSMAEKDYIGSFAGVFEQAGLNLASIDTSQGSAVRLLSHHPKIKERTCLVQLIDDYELTSFLFVGGLYAYSGKTSLHDGSGLGLGTEIARSVGSIMQFIKAQDIDGPITDVYLLGVRPEDYSVCKDNIYQTDAMLKVGILPGEPLIYGTREMEQHTESFREPDDFFGRLLYPVSGFEMIHGKAGFIFQQKRDLRKESLRNTIFKYALSFAAVILIFSFWIINLLGARKALTDAVNNTARYINSEAVNSDVSLYDTYSTKLADIKSRTSAAVKTGRAIDSYPLMNSSVEKLLSDDAVGYAQIKVVGYDSATGLVRLSCTAYNPATIHLYISKLENEKSLVKVEYTGYDRSEDGSYRVGLSCCLSPSAGRTLSIKNREGAGG